MFNYYYNLYKLRKSIENKKINKTGGFSSAEIEHIFVKLWKINQKENK